MPVIGMKDMPDTRQKKYKVPESEAQSADMLQGGCSYFGLSKNDLVSQ